MLKAGEMLGMRFMVTHNLYFYNHLMEEIRDAIEEGRFAEFKKHKIDCLHSGESTRGTVL